MEIETSGYSLLFPEEYSEQAQRAAAILEAAREPVAADLGAQLQSYPIVLNTGRAEANGYVTLAPRHSEWYAYAPPGSFAGPVDWYTLLALHEGRHMAQFDYLDRGFNRFAGIVGGETAQAAFSFFSVPLWFWEGDAILSETMFSNGGRGRSADFHRQIRAILGEGKEFSYQQAFLGSYRRRFPNHYHLGFPMTAYGRIAYGPDFWPEVLEETAAFSFWPLRFSSVLKRSTGSDASEFYERTMKYLRSRWDTPPVRKDSPARSNLPDAPDFPGTVLAAPDGPWRDYLKPEPASDGSVVSLVQGRDTPTRLVRLQPDGRERTVHSFRPNSEHYDIAGSRAVWSESFPHPLWASRSSSDIILYDLSRKKRTRLTAGGSYYSPALSPGGKRIAAVSMQPGGTSRIAVLDAADGRSLGELNTADRSLLLDPAWNTSGSRIAAVVQREGGQDLVEFDLTSGQVRTIEMTDGQTLGNPVYAGGYLLYVSDLSGRREIYAAERDTGRKFRLLPSRYGAGDPAWDPETRSLYFSDYTVHGYRAVQVELDDLLLQPIRDIERTPVDYAESLAPSASRSGTDSAEELRRSAEDAEIPEARPYSPAAHMLNIHSWGILPAEGGRAEAFLLSRDVLRTLQLRSFLGYTAATGTLDTGFRGVYTGSFPLFRFGLRGDAAGIADPGDGEYGLTAHAGIDFPINLSAGLWRQNFEFSTTLLMRGSTAAGSNPGFHGEQAPLRHSLSFYRASRARTPLDFAPPWSQRFELSYIHSLDLFNDLDTRLAGSLELTLPGLLPHHRISGRLAAERLSGPLITLGYTPFRPRGYSFAWREAAPINALAVAEYSAPLFYPEWAVGELFYLKRIRGSLFYDHGAGYSEPELRHYRSVGGELLFEQHFFSAPVSIEFGVRGAYRLEDGGFRLEETLLGFGIEW
jgi:hypothetical protein